MDDEERGEREVDAPRPASGEEERSPRANDAEDRAGERGYEGAGVEEGGGYQRSVEGSGGYEQSGKPEGDYDPRQEGGDQDAADQ